MAPPTRNRVSSSARHRRRCGRIPSFRRLAASQSRHVRIPPSLLSGRIYYTPLFFDSDRRHAHTSRLSCFFIASIGAVHRSRFSLWDLSKLHGGKPTLSGASFPEGAHRFRWCPTYPEYFAISTRNPGARGATIHVHSALHTHSHVEPTTFTLAPRPLRVRDFDFMSLKGIPRVAAAVGHELIVFYIGLE
jgi:hypothetical protein